MTSQDMRNIGDTEGRARGQQRSDHSQSPKHKPPFRKPSVDRQKYQRQHRDGETGEITARPRRIVVGEKAPEIAGEKDRLDGMFAAVGLERSRLHHYSDG